MTFMEKLAAGTAGDINDAVDAWHDDPCIGGPNLHTYLGMTWSEYGVWVQGDMSPQEILDARKRVFTDAERMDWLGTQRVDVRPGVGRDPFLVFQDFDGGRFTSLREQVDLAIAREGRDNAKLPLRHFIVSGRIPGEDEDTVLYVCVEGDEDPADKFTHDILYRGDMPEGWKERDPTWEESKHGEWRFINAVIEVPGPPIE